MKILKNPFLTAALTSGLILPGVHAAVTPYASADADTSYLYHFNEAVGGSSASNAGSTGDAALSVDGNPYAGDAVDQPLITSVLGATAFSGFGNAANVTGDACLGVDSDGNGAFRPGDFSPVGPDQMPNHGTILGTGNAFTLEAMVNVPSITSGSRQIICTDNNNAAVAERGFQFRISATGQLDFNFLGTTPAAFIAPIPTTGPHAFAANQWFHLALTYDGTTMTYYWTRVDSGAVHANPIATNTVETVELADDAILVIGNEGRATGGLGAEPLNGLIDEVRISEVARQATQFIFSDGDDLRDDWEVQYFRENESETLVEILAKFTGSDDPDLDTFSNLAEQAAGSNPTNPDSIPGNADGDGLDDAWEMLHFSDLDEVESGDPDGDFATNEDEQTAGTDPSGADGFLDFPDTEGGTGDGLSDAWEMAFFGDLDETAGDDTDDDLYTHAEEYTLGTNPSDQFSAPDGDTDGLNDGWEAFYFFVSGDDRPTLLARESGASDADSDGYSNEAEETSGTNPTTAQKPSDTDADGLIDSWEFEHFEGSLEPLPGDLTGDGDAFTNLQEQNAGSDPRDTASVPGDIDGDGTPDTAEAFQPYTVDSNTLHLWHLDEVDQPAADAVSGGLTMTALSANGRMWTPSLAGFGTGLNPSLGRGTAAGGVLSALPPTNTTSDNTTLTYAGVDGAFTFEAIVRIDFDPSIAPSSAVPMQIVTGEAEDAPNRVWQLRLVPIGGPGNGAGTTTLLEFINLHGEVGVQSLVAPLPITADPDAIAQNGWYHVAVAYNGSEATADNIKFYWTLLDPARTSANEVFSGQMTNDLITATPDFTIGNEGRDFAGTGSTDSFLGVVDEVRISSIARTPSQFHFISTEIADNLDDTWEMTYFGDLDETDTGDFDSDGTDNLTEFRLGLIPNSGSSRFAAVTTDGNPDDGFTLSWPSLEGTSFNIWRTYDLADWTEIASDVTASPAPATSTSHTDTTPVPPDKKAFYRVEVVSP